MHEDDIISALKAVGVENARFEAQQLIQRFRGSELIQAVERRCGGYPLQYILGEWDFYNETYEVSEDCLIPRADTEHLVEQTVGRLPHGATFLDLCTGSGCVAISALCARPDTRAVAIDLFPKTLAVAERNSVRNGVSERMKLMRADVLCPPPCELPDRGFDAIVSNPPYIRADVMPTLQREVQFEPQAALLGGEDGLDFYRAILNLWACKLKSDGFFLFEIGYDQGEELLALGHERGLDGQVFRDYGGNDRVVYLKKM